MSSRNSDAARLAAWRELWRLLLLPLPQPGSASTRKSETVDAATSTVSELSKQ